MENKTFDVDDRGNVADFFEKQDDDTWEKAARLNREAGPSANEYSWDCWGSIEMEEWACQNGYDDEIAQGKEEENGD